MANPISITDVIHNLTTLSTVGRSHQASQTGLLAPLYCYPYKVRLLYDASYRIYSDSTLPSLLFKTTLAFLKMTKEFDFANFANARGWSTGPRLLTGPLASARQGLVNWYFATPFYAAIENKEDYIDQQLRWTHTGYHHYLNQIVTSRLPALQQYLAKVCRGSDVDDQSLRDTISEIQYFCKYNRSFFDQVQQRSSVWLEALFKTYFCSHCFDHSHAIESYHAITELQSTLFERLPYPMLLDIAFGDKIHQERLDQWIRDLKSHRVGVRLLFRALRGIYEHGVKFHRMNAFTTGQKPSLGLLTMTIRNRAMFLSKAEKVSGLNILEMDDDCHLEWRNRLCEGSLVVLRRFETVGDKLKLCIAEYILGKQIGARREKDKLVYFEIKSGAEIYLDLTDEETDLDILTRQAAEREKIPLKNCSEIVLCFANNEAVLGNIQETILAIEKDQTSPFIHCGMGMNKMVAIDLQGRGAVCQKLEPLFEGTEWVQKKQEEDFQKKIVRLFQNLVKMHYTPIPLKAKYIMKGKTPEGRPIAKYGKISLKGEKDFASLERLAHEIAGDDPQFLKRLLTESGFTNAPEYAFYTKAIASALGRGDFDPSIKIQSTPFRERKSEAFYVKKLQEEIGAVLKIACDDIKYLEPTRIFTEKDFDHTCALLLHLYQTSGWTFQLPPLLHRKVVDLFLKSK